MGSSSRPHSRSRGRTLGVAILAGTMLVVGWGAAASSGAASHEYAVIASPDVEVATLTKPELRRIFMLDRRFWKSGHPIVTLMLPGGTQARTYLLGNVCGLDEAGFRQMLLEKMYRGELDLAPKVVESGEDAVSFVAASHGLIAMVPASLAASGRVRVLAVGGKVPGTAGYPLKD